MPIYDYECSECSHTLEVLQKISDPLLTDCPECGEPALKKQVSAPSFRLAGGGWYETDFKTGNKKNLAGDSAAASGNANGSEGAKSDSPKPDKPKKSESPPAA